MRIRRRVQRSLASAHNSVVIDSLYCPAFAAVLHSDRHNQPKIKPRFPDLILANTQISLEIPRPLAILRGISSVSSSKENGRRPPVCPPHLPSKVKGRAETPNCWLGVNGTDPGCHGTDQFFFVLLLYSTSTVQLSKIPLFPAGSGSKQSHSNTATASARLTSVMSNCVRARDERQDKCRSTFRGMLRYCTLRTV